jgi:hypothetical protein
MTVYVDDMKAPFGNMVMCHLIATTDEELHAMAAKIGVARKWHQAPPRHASHYDIAVSKKTLAIRYGAVPITWRETGMMCRMRRVTGAMGTPQEAAAWYASRNEEAPDASNGAATPDEPAPGITGDLFS